MFREEAFDISMKGRPCFNVVLKENIDSSSPLLSSGSHISNRSLSLPQEMMPSTTDYDESKTNLSCNSSDFQPIPHASKDIHNVVLSRTNSCSSYSDHDCTGVDHDSSASSLMTMVASQTDKIIASYNEAYFNSKALLRRIKPSSSNCPGSNERSATNGLLSALIQKLHTNEETFGAISIQVAESYNAIGIIECRIHKNYDNALRYHNAALRIITMLQEQHQDQQNQELSELHQNLQIIDTYQGSAMKYSDIPQPGLSHQLRYDDRKTTRSHALELHHKIITLRITTLIDMGTCYELLQDYTMATQYYEEAEMCITRNSTTGNNDAIKNPPIVIPKHIIFACRRAIARVKRL